MNTPSLLVLAGDGIGPEVMDEVKRIITWFGDKRDLSFDVSEDLVGGAAYDAHGVPLHDDTMAKAQEVDAVLLGAVGGPKYDELDFSLKPERGLLRLRKEMDLFANLRPAQCFDALADFSSRAGFSRKTASGWGSTPSAIRKTRSTVWHALRSSWRASGATRCVPWKKPTSWKAVSCGAMW